MPVGVTCRFCERTDCHRRAAPSYESVFRLDACVRTSNFFSPLVEGDEKLALARKKA